MPCEMCGKDVPLRRALIEGTTMSVCGSCVKFGIEQAPVGVQEVTGRSRVVESLERRDRRQKTRDIYSEMSEELVPDYADVIRDARTRRGLDLDALAAKLLEKRTVLARVEAAEMRPPDALVKKLERELEIKLMEKPDAAIQPKKAASRSLTLGDLIKEQMKKKD